METPLSEVLTNLDFPLKICQSRSFLNAINNHDTNQFQMADIEMIAIESLTYTSLRDLLPASPPASITSPMDSWREIPIKDPLVKHAAWAYLRPMTTEIESDQRRCLPKLKDGLFGCFGGFFSDVVAVTVKNWFSESESEVDGGDEVD